MKKSHLLVLNSFAVLGLVSCGTTGYTHTQSSELRHYKADLNHDGKIEKFSKIVEGQTIEIDEENLTWSEAYDSLIEEAASTELLNVFADNMGIAKAEPQRTNLARYEIMHQAEELAMSTGALIPLYNYQDPYLLKTDVSGIYCSGIGGKFYDQLVSSTGKKDFKFSIGTKANSFDPAVNDDSSTASVIVNCFAGLCKWEKNENEIAGQSRTYGSHIKENTDIVESFERTIDPTTKVATYKFKLKSGLKFTSGNSLTADNFIWAWNRAASPYTGTWVSMFENIKGYSDWKAKCKKAIDEEQPQPKFVGENEGMSGIKKTSDLEFSVTLVNDCAYFKDLLAFPAYLPLDMKVIEECEKNNKIWWLDPSTFSTNGRLRVTELKNYEAGGVKMEKWSDYETTTQTPTTTKINSMYLTFLDSDSAMWDKYKSNALDMIDNVATSLIQTIKKERKDEWRIAPQVGIYFFLHNVNDNTFDIRANQSETDRENLRKAFNLLLNRHDYTETIVRSGATDASGFVSSGITEQCIPGIVKENGTPEQNGLYCKRVGDTETEPNLNGELVSADWHERNLDMNKYWNTDGDTQGDKLGYRKHWLQYRTKGGFLDSVTDTGKTSEQVMRKNVEDAINLAKSAGVNYQGNLDSGKFTNFPTVTITTNTGSGHESLCERMQFALKDFGINIRIQTQEWNAFQGTKKSGAFAVARNGWIADYSDPLTYLSIVTASSSNNDTQLGKEGFHKSR